MVSRRQAGYTVVEITLFLAISGLLLMIALLGTGNTLRSLRFTDSGRSLAAYVQRQYDQIINGLNTRLGDESCSGGTVSTNTPQTPGTSDCLLMGELLIFNTNTSTINTYQVVGVEPAGVDYTQSDTELITAFAPRLVTNAGTGEYQIPWGAIISGTKRLSDDKGVDALLLVRSPKSSRIVSYTYKKPTVIGTNLVDIDTVGVVSNPDNIGKTSNFCIKNNDGLGLPAKLVVSDAPTQSAVQVFFEADSGGSECNGT